MSKYKRAFDTWELEIYGDAEESFRQNGITCLAKLLLRRCKNYYDSWERVMQRTKLSDICILIKKVGKKLLKS